MAAAPVVVLILALIVVVALIGLLWKISASIDSVARALADIAREISRSKDGK